MSGRIDLTLADGVARLHFNCPERMNVLDPVMADSFAAAVADVLADPSIRVLLMTGAGRSFMAGGDLASFHGAENKADPIRATIPPIHRGLLALEKSPVVTLVAAQGRVAGAGVSLVAGADLALAEEGASFTLAYCRIGAVPDCGGSWALPRAVGLKRAMEMALLNEPVPAEQACRIGLINRVVPAGRLEEDAVAMAHRVAAGPGFAQGRAKALLRAAFETSLADQLDAEEASFLTCVERRDFREGVGSFLERRSPEFNKD